jgi:sulfoxide reductase heme-binding subunit YedZ
MEKHIDAIRRTLFLLCLLPLAYLGLALGQDPLEVNSIEVFTRQLGFWALNLLLLTLTITPLRRLSGWTWLLKLRRTLGRFVFFYACLHLIAYLWLDQRFDWPAIGDDILKQPFIVAGMLAFALLIPLAITSSNAMVRRLGGPRWQELHRLIYPLAMLAVLHYTWMVKADILRPTLYGVLLALLLLPRLWWRLRESQPRRPAGMAHFPQIKGRIIPIIPRR